MLTLPCRNDAGGIRVTDTFFETKVQKLKGGFFSISNQNYEDLSFYFNKRIIL